MADYTPQVERARASIARKGRAVTFIRLASDVDPAKPLEGPQGSAVEVAGVPAVFVSPSGGLGYGVRDANLFKNCTQIAIVASNVTYDFSTFDLIRDFDNSEWKIDHVEMLRPAEQIILFFIGVRRP